MFLASLRLGLSAFGGPIAHLGYFRRAYVDERGWIDPVTFGGIVGLCQVLPGPTSSQVGFLVGWHRAGWRGALAAWLGFTLPAALLMYGFARVAPRWRGVLPDAVMHGLTLAAIAIVAQAVWTMGRTLCSDGARRLFALVAGGIVLAVASPVMQLIVMLSAAAGGALWLGVGPAAVAAPLQREVSRPVAVGALAVFAVLLLGALGVATLGSHSLVTLAGIFFRAGAGVFGGGHVVLPLLRDSLVPQGWLPDATFLEGYGAAQVLPGPLFTFSVYLGASMAPAGEALPWALCALLALFLPGMLVAVAGAALWGRMMRGSRAHAALAGVNAAVVGILGAALCNPLLVTGVRSATDALIGLLALWLLQARRVAPLIIVAGCIAATLLVGGRGV